MFESCLSILYNGYMKKIYTSVFFLLSVLAIDLHASDLSECKGSPLEVDSKNDTSKELRNSWTNCSATLTYVNGDKYVGLYKDGKRTGQGTYTWAEGHKYVGEHKDSKAHGQGTFTYADGDKYVGEFKDDKRHGQGTYTSANGDKYVGEYKDDKRHGQGTYTFANGNKYVGEWKDSNYNGQGTMTYADGGSYVGEWKDDKRHGQGIENYSNGNIYEGDYLNDRWHGDGVFYGKDEKKVFVSSFVDGSTSTTKKGLAFEIYEPDIALRCLYKGPQVYKHNEKQIEFTNVGGIELLLKSFKNQKFPNQKKEGGGDLYSYHLDFKKKFSLVKNARNYISDDTKMDVLRNQLECKQDCRERLGFKGKYIMWKDPAEDIRIKVNQYTWSLNRENLRLHPGYFSGPQDKDYYQCTIVPTHEFLMFHGKILFEIKNGIEDIEKENKRQELKNKI